MNDTKLVRENIARARTLLRRQEFASAMRMLSTAMSQYAETKAMGSARYEVEGALRDILEDCNCQPQVRDILAPAACIEAPRLKYVRGKEAILARLCASLATSLEHVRRRQVQAEEQQWLARRKRLTDKAKSLLDEGDLSRGLAFIRRLLEEYGDSDPDLHLYMAESLRDADLPLDAAEILDAAMESFPKEAALYAASIDVYASIGRLDKAEIIFRKGIRRFGAHPRNLLAMARLYAEAGQRAKAVSMLYHILQDHPDFADAKDLLAQVEFR